MKLRAAPLALALGALFPLAACGDGGETTVTKTVETTVTVTTTTPAATATTPPAPPAPAGGGAGAGSGSGSGGTAPGGSAAGEYQRCVEQTGNPDFCANPPPGE